MKIKNFNAIGWLIIAVCLAMSFVIDNLWRYHIELKAGLGVVLSLAIILAGIGLALRFGTNTRKH